MNNYLKILTIKRIKKIGSFNLFMFASFVLEHGINKVLLMPFLARHLGEAKFGSFLLAMSIAVFLAGIIPAGLFMTNYRENSKFDNKERKELFDTILTVLIILSCIFAILYLVFKGQFSLLFDDTDIILFIPFLAGYIIFYVVFNFGKQLLAIDLKFKQRTLFDVIYGLCLCLLIPGYFVFGEQAVSASYFIGSIISAGSIFIYLKNKQVVLRLRVVSDKLKLLITTSPTFTVASFAVIFMTVADRWIIGAYLQQSQVTYYYVGVHMAALFVLPFSLLNSVLVPIITKKNSLADFDQSEIKIFFLGLVLSIIFVATTSFFLGPLVIKLLYGQDILEYARVPFMICMVGQILFLLQIFSRPFVVKFFAPEMLLKIQMTSLCVFLILHFILVPQFGIIGGAVATSIGFGLMGLLYSKQVLYKIYLTTI